MPVTRYGFSTAISAFFEIQTDLATVLLPPHLQPLETQRGTGIFAVTAFDFTESMVGAYQEIVLAVIVPPVVKADAQFPKSAFYPFLVGTSTMASREHAIERWHLPHYMEDVAIDFAQESDSVGVRVHEDGRPILDMEISQHRWEKADDLYQSFMVDGKRNLKVDIHMQGTFSEHEEEKGRIEIHDHPMTERLDPEEIETVPFRELWMRAGMQTVEELETLEMV
jgi:hypothetical protein